MPSPFRNGFARRFIAAATLAAAANSPKVNAATEADFVGPIARETVVAHAVAHSPALAALAHRSRALVHAGRAEGSLPPAEFGFEAWNLPLTRPYAVGEADMYMLELRQRFPAMGSRDARARAMAEEAQATVAELASEERLVAERTAIAFADLVQSFAEQRLQARQIELLSRMGQAIRARYTTGGTALSEAARIDVEIAKAERALARVVGDIARSRATLNALLRRPPGAPLGPPRVTRPETVRMTVEELIARAEAARGTVLSANAREKAADARREAAEAESRVPELMFGFGYWQDPMMRPGVGVTASMSLPWLSGANRNRVHQAKEDRAAERANRENVSLDLQTEVSEAHARLLTLEAQRSVIREQALPATSRSMEALNAAFATGNASLLDWIDAARSVLELEMELIVLHGELQRGVASLERAVGTVLPRTHLDGSEHDQAEEPTP